MLYSKLFQNLVTLLSLSFYRPTAWAGLRLAVLMFLAGVTDVSKSATGLAGGWLGDLIFRQASSGLLSWWWSKLSGVSRSIQRPLGPKCRIAHCQFCHLLLA